MDESGSMDQSGGMEEPKSTAGEGAPIPVRLRDEGRTATWNPAMTAAGQVILRIRREDGEIILRRTVNSGRARVRTGEVIDSVIPAE
jgi:hypothetical protein